MILQNVLFARAKKDLDAHTKIAMKWEELCDGLDKSCLLLTPFCGGISCEELIKKDSARQVSARTMIVIR